MSHAGSLTDLEAVRAFARSRDPRAFEVLLERYQRMVLSTCLRVLGDRGHAEDATQETFLKLARHAGEITSNAGAWLHRCATRTAIDAQRALRVRRDAEARAATPLAAADAGEEKTWKEIEPLVDAALERLRDEDREVLVLRFLLGRSQVSMAAEAGINAGTMSRRIDRALSKLHAELGRSGVEIAGVGALGGAMVLAARSVGPGLDLAAGLGKIGLAAGAPSGGGAAVSKGLGVAAAAVLAAGGIGVGAMLIGSGGIGGSGGGGQSGVAPGSGSMGAAVEIGSVGASVGGDPVDRPGRAVRGLTLVHHQIGGPMSPTMVCDGETLEMSLPSWNGETERMSFRVVDWTRGRSGRGSVTLRTVSLELRDGSPLAALEGRTFEADWSFDSADRLALSMQMVEGESASRVTWRGVAVGGQEDRETGCAFVGEWAELSDWSMNLTEEILEVMMDGHAVYRFRVLKWGDRLLDDGVVATGIESLCVDAMAPQLVGQRVKLLLRERDGAYELSFRQWPRDRVDEWPEGFVADQDNALNVLAFRRVK
ncbi:MAG: sigma-70 family RNA polymerase sigma factor [Planctomycetota bacterium]